MFPSMPALAVVSVMDNWSLLFELQLGCSRVQQKNLVKWVLSERAGLGGGGATSWKWQDLCGNVGRFLQNISHFFKELNSKSLFGTESFVGDGFGITHSPTQVDPQITSLGLLHLAKTPQQEKRLLLGFLTTHHCSAWQKGHLWEKLVCNAEICNKLQ